jgi:CheY-specific phosphatase CheX
MIEIFAGMEFKTRSIEVIGPAGALEGQVLYLMDVPLAKFLVLLNHMV